MCNRYANRVSYPQYVEEFSDTRLPLVSPGPDRAPNIEPRDNIRPTERAEVLLPVEGGLELRTMRWGLIPWFHKKTLREWKRLMTNVTLLGSRGSPALSVLFAGSAHRSEHCSH